MKYIGLVIAIVIAVVAAFLVLNASKPDASPPPRKVEVAGKAQPQIREVSVYVAARDIPVGSVIDANMLTTRPWPEHLVVEGFVVGEQEGRRVIDTVARAAFKRNEPLNKAKLINPDDPNFLAGELGPGMRLVTMGADEISAVAGFIFPGDRVDVLITHRLMRDGFSEDDLEELSYNQITESVTERLLADVRVLAVDQRSSAGADQKGPAIVIPRSVSLEVPLEDAQRLRLAQEVGQLSIALRSVEDKDSQGASSVTRPADLTLVQPSNNADSSEGADRRAKKEKEAAVRVIRGTELEEQPEE